MHIVHTVRLHVCVCVCGGEVLFCRCLTTVTPCMCLCWSCHMSLLGQLVSRELGGQRISLSAVGLRGSLELGLVHLLSVMK